MQVLPQPLFPHVAEHYEKEEGYTPRYIVEAVREVLGEIDLDPASCALANETVKATRYFDKETNGLIQPWQGRVFLNPPYTFRRIDLFIERLWQETTNGNIESACILTMGVTQAPWFQRLASVSTAICALSKFVMFRSPTRGEFKTYHGQTIAYIGPDIDRFARVFAPIGLIVVPYRVGAS